jgi:hypothetical protein
MELRIHETAKGEKMLFRQSELLEAALDSYRDSVGRMIGWPVFSSFTERRGEAEDCERAWRDGVPVLVQLRSTWYPRLRNGTYLLHPFTMLQVDAVLGKAVKLGEAGFLERGRMRPLPRQRPELVPKGGRVTKLYEAAEEGDVRAIAKVATRGEFVNARDADGWTPLHSVSYKGKIEAVKALASLGGGMGQTGWGDFGFRRCAGWPRGVVKAVASLGAGVNLPVNDGSTPFCIAAEGRHVEVLKALAARGADVKAQRRDGGLLFIPRRSARLSLGDREGAQIARWERECSGQEGCCSTFHCGVEASFGFGGEGADRVRRGGVIWVGGRWGDIDCGLQGAGLPVSQCEATRF